MRVAVVVATVVALGGCSSRDGAPVDFDRTIAIAANDYEGASLFSAVVARTLCGAADEEHCRLDRTPVAALADDGSLLLTSEGGPVVVIDDSGRVRRVIGEGAGPTNYTSVAALTIDSAANVWLFDIRSWSWLGLSLSGELLARHSVRPGMMMRKFAARSGALYWQEIPAGERRGSRVVSSFFRTDGTGVGREFAQVPAFATQRRESDLMPMPQFFSPEPVWDIARDGGLWYSNGGAYRVMRFGADGRPLLAIEVDGVSGRQVTSADVEFEKQRRGFSTQRSSSMDSAILAAAEDRARRYPAITDVRVLRDSTLLVRRAPDAAHDSVRWDIWATNGRLLGSLKLGVADHVIDGRLNQVLVATPVQSGAARIAWIRLRALDGGPT